MELPAQVPQPMDSVKGRALSKPPPLPKVWAWFDQHAHHVASPRPARRCARLLWVWMPTEWPLPCTSRMSFAPSACGVANRGPGRRSAPATASRRRAGAILPDCRRPRPGRSLRPQPRPARARARRATTAASLAITRAVELAVHPQLCRPTLGFSSAPASRPPARSSAAIACVVDVVEDDQRSSPTSRRWHCRRSSSAVILRAASSRSALGR